MTQATDFDYFLGSLLGGFRRDLLEICDEVAPVCWLLWVIVSLLLRRQAMKRIRAWRQTERKKMIESMERLLAQAQKLAVSQYTRSSERSKWTRLAGQL